jgi:trehalose/maltose hydrolase-like predicted phosphorylase
LSPSFHALAATRLGDLETARRYFDRAARLDLDFTHGVTAAGGVHIAALGGMWHALVFGFGGMFVEDEGPWFGPHVPEDWQTLRFSVLWGGSQLRVATTKGTAEVATEHESPSVTRNRPLASLDNPGSPAADSDRSGSDSSRSTDRTGL